MTKPYYVVIDTTGKIAGPFKSESACAAAWVPGTFWGGGYKDQARRQPRDYNEAVAHAMEYVNALRAA